MITREDKWKEIDDILAQAKNDLAEATDILDEIEHDMTNLKKRES